MKSVPSKVMVDRGLGGRRGSGRRDSAVPTDGVHGAPPTSREAFEEAARDFCASRRSKGTQQGYEADLDCWLRFCAERNATPERPTLALATAFRDSLTGLAPLTVRRKLASLSSVYAAVLAQETPRATWNPFNPRVLPQPPPTSFASTEAVKEDVVNSLVRVAEAEDTMRGRRDVALLRLLHDTGLRRMSIAKMRRDWIFDRNGETIARVIIKGDKIEEITVPKPAHLAMQRWLEVAPESIWVFPGRNVANPICDRLLNDVLNARGVEAGVKTHPHSFRAAFVTTAYDSGMNERDIQASVHHKDPRTTQRYDRGTRGAGVTAAVEKFRKGRKNDGH